eukprot:3895922-Amphidinium_carterae.1
MYNTFAFHVSTHFVGVPRRVVTMPLKQETRRSLWHSSWAAAVINSSSSVVFSSSDIEGDAMPYLPQTRGQN